VQADETPIRYLAPGTGKAGQGYLWTLHRPGGDVLFQWHASRASDCLKDLLGVFRGILQCDGCSAYGTHPARNPGITLAACWAHARRKFHEALQTGQKPAAGPLKAIATIYGIEKELRQSRAGPEERAAIRQRDSAPILQSLRGDLLQLRGHPSVTPKSPLSRAIKYTLGLWPRLEVFLRHGEVEADTNLAENAIRPTAVGTKNWLFVGCREAGQRAAVLDTIIENCRRLGINTREYLEDVLTRLAMKESETAGLTPANWLRARQADPESGPSA
jgi:transposase